MSPKRRRSEIKIPLPPVNRRYAALLPALLVGLVGFLIYFNSLKNGYALDDIAVVQRNVIVQKGLEGIPELLTTSYWLGYKGASNLGYRPLSMVMFAVEWEFFPHNPKAGHLANILLYALTGFLLFRFLHRLFKNESVLIPFSVALLFMVHPVHTEVVDNIKSRDELLSFFFMILSAGRLMKFTESGRWFQLVISLVFYFLALLSKENSFTFVAVVPLLIWFFSSIPLRRNLMATGGFVLVTAAAVAWRIGLLGEFSYRENLPVIDNILVAAPDMATRLATAIKILGNYLWLLVWPSPLICDYSVNYIPLSGWSEWRVWLSVFALILLAAVALAGVRKKDPVAFGILFFFATVSVVSNVFVLIGATMAERFMYTPVLGIIIAAVFLIKKIPVKNLIRPGADFGRAMLTSPLFTFFVLATGLACSAIVVARNRDWANNYILFSADVKKAPESAKLNYYYGASLVETVVTHVNTGQPLPAERKNLLLDEALTYLRKAVMIRKDFADAHAEIGLALYHRGKLVEAMENFFQAVQYDTMNVNTLNNFGLTCIDANRPENAAELLERAVKIRPGFAEAHNNLGVAYFNMGRFEKARDQYKKAVYLAPRYTMAYMNLGVTYNRLGDYRTSLEYFEKALSLDPGNKHVYYRMALTCKAMGDKERAEHYFKLSGREDHSGHRH